jgi:hypothetical protein
MSEFDLPSGGADYGFGGSDSFTLGSENVSATGSSGGASDSDRAFFGGSDTPNIMDFGRGTVSNITNAVNYDPNFAALNMIGRGLTPSSALRDKISFDVPSSMLPQILGDRLNARGEPVRYYSQGEKFLQETLPPIIQGIRKVSPTGIIMNLINRGMDVYDKGKEVIEETFEPEKKTDEKTDVGIMQNMDRANLTDAGRAILAGMQNNNRNLPPVTQTADLNFKDLLTSPGMINKVLNSAQPYLQQVVPEGFNVNTVPKINFDEGTFEPRIELEYQFPNKDFGLGNLFRNLG